MDVELLANAPECADYLDVFESPVRDAGYAAGVYHEGGGIGESAESVVILPTEQAAIDLLDAVGTPGFLACNLIWQQRATDLYTNIPTSYRPVTGEAFDVSVADQAVQMWVNNSYEDQAVLFLRVGRGVSILNPGGVGSGVTNEDVQALIPAAIDRLHQALDT